MPEPFEFQREDDGSLPLQSAIYQALGAASTCWENMEGTGVFQDGRAREIGQALYEEVRKHRAAATLTTEESSDHRVVVQYPRGAFTTSEEAVNAVRRVLTAARHKLADVWALPRQGSA